jgi:hypothetical protein
MQRYAIVLAQLSFFGTRLHRMTNSIDARMPSHLVACMNEDALDWSSDAAGFPAYWGAT